MEELKKISKKSIEKLSKEKIIDISVENLKINKQVLIFNSSKSSSEKSARVISEFLEKNKYEIENKDKLLEISKKILNTLDSPTSQCKILSKYVEYGIAFHHSGLVSKQKEIIEENFKKGYIKIISSTPTLAAGLNLPAYCVVIKDYKRYTKRGYNDIPVLEYQQMSGRAGRPGLEDKGVCITMIKNEFEIEKVYNRYIYGESEEILSKLSNEKILRMYILSLISTEIINTEKEIYDFFSNTLYFFQYKDLNEIIEIINRCLKKLIEYNFLTNDDDYFLSTNIGKRVSELYINPDTANFYLKNLNKFIASINTYNTSKFDTMNFLICIFFVYEFEPHIRVYKDEEEIYYKFLEENEKELFLEFNPYEMDLYNLLCCVKESEIIYEWINETKEDYICEKYRITPGELKYKLEVLDWLLYTIEEFSLIKKNFFFKNFLNKFRRRVQNGIRLELINLIEIKGIGKVRARKLFENNIKSIEDIKNIDHNKLIEIIGDKTSKNILKDLKIDENIELPKQIKQRSVLDDEVNELLLNEEIFEKEKKDKSLKDFFN